MSGTVGYDDNLVGVGIVEKDKAEDVQLVWAYPSLSPSLSKKVLAHSGLPTPAAEGAGLLRFRYNNFSNEWVHIWAAVLPEDASPLLASSLQAFAVVLVTKQFNPEKYAAISEALWRTYAATASTPAVLGLYLGIFRSNRAELNDQVLFSDEDNKYDPRRALLVANLKDISRSFGEGTINIWTALMLKRRVAVFSERLVALLRIIRGLPALVWHRQDWNVLRPHVDLASEEEVADLRAAGVYCAGFTDPAIKANGGLWDVLVDIDAREVRVSEERKADFELTGFQRGLSKFIVESADDAEVSAQQHIRALAEKTRELLAKLLSLRVEDPSDGSLYISMEGLQAVKLPAKMDTFLYAIAVAEGFTKLYDPSAAAPSS